MLKLKLNALSKNISNFLFHLTGWSMISVAIIDPFVYNFELKRSNLDLKQHKMLLFQEVVRQSINIGIDLLSFFAVGLLVKTRLKNHPQKDLWQFIGGTLGNFLGKSFVRPIVTLKATSWWAERYGEKPGTEKQPPIQTPLKRIASPMTQYPLAHAPSFRPVPPSGLLFPILPLPFYAILLNWFEG